MLTWEIRSVWRGVVRWTCQLSGLTFAEMQICGSTGTGFGTGDRLTARKLKAGNQFAEDLRACVTKVLKRAWDYGFEPFVQKLQ